MADRTSRGEPERVGSIILRCIDAAQKGYYRPQRLFRHKQQKKKPAGSTQRALKFTEAVRDFERLLIDLIPEAYG